MSRPVLHRLLLRPACAVDLLVQVVEPLLGNVVGERPDVCPGSRRPGRTSLGAAHLNLPPFRQLIGWLMPS